MQQLAVAACGRRTLQLLRAGVVIHFSLLENSCSSLLQLTLYSSKGEVIRKRCPSRGSHELGNLLAREVPQPALLLLEAAASSSRSAPPSKRAQPKLTAASVYRRRAPRRGSPTRAKSRCDRTPLARPGDRVIGSSSKDPHERRREIPAQSAATCLPSFLVSTPLFELEATTAPDCSAYAWCRRQCCTYTRL